MTTTKQQPSLTVRIFFTTLWAWVLVIGTFQYLQLHESGWERHTLQAAIVITILFLSINISKIVTGKYRR